MKKNLYRDVAKERNVSIRTAQRWVREIRAGMALRAEAGPTGDVDFDALVIEARYKRVEAELAGALAKGDVKRAKQLYDEKMRLFNTYYLQAVVF